MSQLIEITASSGLTGLVGKLFADGSDTIIATSSAVAEATNRKSIYVATFTGVTVGTYQLLLLDGDGLPVASRIVRVTATSGTFTEIDEEEAILTAIDNIETGAITGDNEIAVTITDSDTSEPIEGAIVRYYRTGQAGGGTATVDTDGEVIVGLNSATWKWIASANGYDSKTGTLVVSADGPHDIELDLSFAEVADAPYCNVTLPAISQFTEEAAGIPCEFDFLGFLSGATRTAIVLNLPPDLVTGSDGTITVRLARLARYRVTYKITLDDRKFETKIVNFSTPNSGSYTVVEQ